MTIVLAALAALTMQADDGLLPAPFGTETIGEERRRRGDKGPPSPLDVYSLNDMFKLISLPQERLREARCAGLATFEARNAGPPSPANAARFRAAVVSALAADTGFEPDKAAALVDGFDEQLAWVRDGKGKPDPDQPKQDWPTFHAEKRAECTDLLAMANSDATPTLLPAVDRSIVDPMFAKCYALYTLAAEAKTDEEAAALRRNAERARAKALDGKTGAALAAAEAALDETLALGRKQLKRDDEGSVMELITCLPALSDSPMLKDS